VSKQAEFLLPEDAWCLRIVVMIDVCYCLVWIEMMNEVPVAGAIITMVKID
jgi:hypothetical protein